ncbi:MAG: pyridoxal-dependent decarboxylase [Bacteroidota bacterium]
MQNDTLDLSTSDFKILLEKSTQLVLQQFKQLDQQKAYHAHEQAAVQGWFDEPLPQEGMNALELLDETEEKILKTATGNLGPHMYAYVMAGGTQISIVAEQLAATINQNVGKWHLAPAISEIEKRVVRWSAELLDLDDFHSGVLVSGGSAANLAGLQVARNVFFEKLGIRQKGLFGQKPFIVYASKEVHGCVDKSLDTLGIGTNNLRKIATNEDFTINLVALEQQIEQDKAKHLQPFCIVGNAGTVNTGAVDDFVALSKIAKKHGLWLHLDGAYGGLAAAAPSAKGKYAGMHLADSIATDFHKWLYQPFEVGCLLVKDWATLRRTYFKPADYLDTSFEQQGRLDFNEHYFQLSRNAKALKVWMTYKAYGARRIVDMIQKDIDLAQYLANQVEATPDFELVARSPLAIACFRYVGNLKEEQQIIELNQALIPALEQDGRVFITGTKLNGVFVLRACLINHRKTEATTDYLLTVIREVAQQLQS